MSGPPATTAAVCHRVPQYTTGQKRLYNTVLRATSKRNRLLRCVALHALRFEVRRLMNDRAESPAPRLEPAALAAACRRAGGRGGRKAHKQAANECQKFLLKMF